MSSARGLTRGIGPRCRSERWARRKVIRVPMAGGRGGRAPRSGRRVTGQTGWGTSLSSWRTRATTRGRSSSGRGRRHPRLGAEPGRPARAPPASGGARPGRAAGRQQPARGQPVDGCGRARAAAAACRGRSRRRTADSTAADQRPDQRQVVVPARQLEQRHGLAGQAGLGQHLGLSPAVTMKRSAAASRRRVRLRSRSAAAPGRRAPPRTACDQLRPGRGVGGDHERAAMPGGLGARGLARARAPPRSLST